MTSLRRALGALARVASALLAVLLAAFVLASCSSGETAPGAAAQAVPANPTAPPPDEPAETPTPDRLADWAPELRELVAFIEAERNEQFRTVAVVEYVDPSTVAEQFASQIPDVSTLPPEALLTLDHLDGMYRATGLATTEFDYLTATSAITSEVVAFYDPERARIVFASNRDTDAAEPLLVEERVVAVHELTHALQGQARLARASASGEPTLIRALIEGEAEWVLDRYVDTLSAGDRRDWVDFRGQRRQPLEDAPEILTADFSLPYELGSAFFAARHATNGLAGVDAAFDAPKLSARSILDPWAFDEDRSDVGSLSGDMPVLVGATPVRIGGEFPFTAPRWYQIFAAAMPTDQALLAAREIIDFRLPAAWLDRDGRLCFAVQAAPTDGGTSRVGDALDSWAAADPDRREIVRIESGFRVEGCDPGTNGPEPSVMPIQAIARAALIIDAETWAVEQGLDPEVGFCIGWTHIEALDRDLEYGASEWLVDLELEDAPADCL